MYLNLSRQNEDLLANEAEAHFKMVSAKYQDALKCQKEEEILYAALTTS